MISETLQKIHQHAQGGIWEESWVGLAPYEMGDPIKTKNGGRRLLSYNHMAQQRFDYYYYSTWMQIIRFTWVEQLFLSK